MLNGQRTWNLTKSVWYILTHKPLTPPTDITYPTWNSSRFRFCWTLAAVCWAWWRNIVETATLAPILRKHNYIQRHTKLENTFLTNMTTAPQILLKSISLFTSLMVPINSSMPSGAAYSPKPYHDNLQKLNVYIWQYFLSDEHINLQIHSKFSFSENGSYYTNWYLEKGHVMNNNVTNINTLNLLPMCTQI